MNSRFLPTLVLPLVLCSCSSVKPAQGVHTYHILSIDQAPKIHTSQASSSEGSPTLVVYVPYDENDDFKLPFFPLVRHFPDRGSATLDFVIAKDGSVLGATIAKGTGNPRSDEAILRVYQRARYTLPLPTDGHPPYLVREKIRFPNLHRNVQTFSAGPFPEQLAGPQPLYGVYGPFPVTQVTK